VRKLDKADFLQCFEKLANTAVNSAAMVDASRPGSAASSLAQRSGMYYCYSRLEVCAPAARLCALC